MGKNQTNESQITHHTALGLLVLAVTGFAEVISSDVGGLMAAAASNIEGANETLQAPYKSIKKMLGSDGKPAAGAAGQQGDGLTWGLTSQQWKQVMFTGGFLNSALTSYFLGRSLSAICWWYVAKWVVFISYRTYSFRKIGMHYYVFDFCYLATLIIALMVVYWTVAADFPVQVFYAMYTISQGVLLFAIPVFSNQLRLHSIQHMISTFIHLTPAFVTFAIRHNHDGPYAPYEVEHLPAEVLAAGALPNSRLMATVDPNLALRQSTAISFSAIMPSWAWQYAFPGMANGTAPSFELPPHPNSVSYWELVSSAIWPYYIVWAAFYFVFIFVVRARRIKQRNYETLFVYMVQRRRGSSMSRLVRTIAGEESEMLQAAVYMLTHGLMACLFCCIGAATWYLPKQLHFLWVAGIAGCAIWNASASYFPANPGEVEDDEYDNPKQQQQQQQQLKAD